MIRSSIGKMDIPCRFGGEEFSVVLPSSDLTSCIQVAERIRRNMMDTPVLLGTFL